MTTAATIWHLTDDGRDHRELVVGIPLRTVSESNARGHWATKARRAKQQRTTTGLVVSGHLAHVGVSLPCVVVLTRHGPSQGLDDDNLRGSLKAVRDGVADALRVDDRDNRVTWTYGQRRSKTWGVEIRVRRASAVD